MAASTVTLIVELAVKEDRRAEFRAVAGRFRHLVESNEPGTLSYDWWLANDANRAMIIETFRDSDALADHMADTAPIVDELLAVADLVRLDVLGSPVGRGRSAVEGSATGWLGYVGGIVR